MPERSHLMWVVNLRKIVPTCTLIASWNSLSSLSKMCTIQPHSSTIFQEKMSIQKKISSLLLSKLKDHVQPWKKAHHDLWLVTFPFQNGTNKSNTKGGFREGAQVGEPPSQDELMKRREEAEGLEEAGSSSRSSLTPQILQMAAEVGTLQSRPTVGGKAPHKEFMKQVQKGGLKKPQRYWPGTVTLYKIHQYQRSTELLICKCPFACLVHKIAQECGRYDLHFQVCMVIVQQEPVEYYLTSLLEDANLCAIMQNSSQSCWKISNWPIISIIESVSGLFLLVGGCVGSTGMGRESYSWVVNFKC